LPQVTTFDQSVIAGVEQAKEIIIGVRNVRAQKNIPQKEQVALEIIGEHNAAFDAVINKLANLSQLDRQTEKSGGAVSFLVGTSEYAVPLGGLLNVEEELKKLNEELEYNKGFLISVMKKLSNEKFVNSAPPKVVDVERKKQADAESKIKSLEESIASLSK
jgi:valyl-tRNA synthetase